jgi:hypothetical protein
MERSIEDWCRELGLHSYKITDDGIVNINGGVDISKKDLEKIPIHFGIVADYFWCNNNKLISLEGSPKSLNGNFVCLVNQLTSLEGAPISIDGSFHCNHNKLTSFKGSPRLVSRHFFCHHNELISLEYGPIKVGGKFICYGNPVYEEYMMEYDSYQHYMRSIKLKQLLCKNDQ